MKRGSPPIRLGADLVTCACGCGGTFTSQDVKGRERRYLIGHHPRRAPTQQHILAAFTSDAPVRTCTLLKRTALDRTDLMNGLRRLRANGLVKHAGRGWYTRVGAVAVQRRAQVA